MFKVTMTNLGRTHANEVQTFRESPTYYDLWGMAREHLLSSHISFNIHVGDFNKSDYPVSGVVLAGAHHVGDFRVEKIRTINENPLIPRIQSAISTEKVTLQQLNAERNKILRALYCARFIDACDIHRIEAQYATKIDNTSHDIKSMERHVAELKVTEL